jgi:hypothetical protein
MRVNSGDSGTHCFRPCFNKKFIEGRRESLETWHKMVEHTISNLFYDRLCLFDKLLRISFGHLSLDRLHVSRGWKNGVEGNEFYLSGHHDLQHTSLRVWFKYPLASRNLGVLNGYAP